MLLVTLAWLTVGLPLPAASASLPLPPVPPSPPVLPLPLPPEPPPLPLPPDPHARAPLREAKAPPAAAPVAPPAVPTVNTSNAAGSESATPEPSGNLAGDMLGLAARLVSAPDGDLAAVLLPFGPKVGAAAFRRGSAGYVVFDERRPIDMAALATDAVLGAARVLLLPQGTLLRVPLSSDLRLALAHQPAGWVVTVTRSPSKAHAILANVAQGSLVLPLPTAAGTVTMPDPMSGADLLVGTAHEAGMATPFARHLPSFTVLPTWLGVVIEARSDRLTLSPTMGGFRLSAGAIGGLSLAPTPHGLAAFARAAGLTRRFDFPALPLPVLARRLARDRAMVLAAPAGARFTPRLAEVQALIALGMGHEAGSLLELALADNPRHAADPSVHGLVAIAALLAGEPERAGGLTDPALSGSDEIALWRAVRAAMQHEDPVGTAPVFAATAPLILTYPAPLVRFLAPLAAEAMIAGGKLDVASAFLAEAPATPHLDLDRAALLAARGNQAGALALYEKLARSIDRPVAARAASRATLLRRALGRIDARAAADALARQLYAWRGPRHELRLRLKIAELRAESSEWRNALSLLRRTATLFPKDAAAIDTARTAIFRRLLAGSGTKRVSPLEFVSLIEENADLIPKGTAGQKLAELLSNRLLALDLPSRAAPVLAKLMQDAPPGAPLAMLGAKLASVRLAEDDAKGAFDALNASRAADLPRPLAVARTLLYARAAAASGQIQEAAAALSGIDDPAALKMRAGFLEKTKQWKAAEAELARLVARTVPPSGVLSEKNTEALVQLASMASRANDTVELLSLHATYGPRIGEGSLADTFHLFTDPPAQSLADLPEVTRDTAIAERLPAEIKAIGGTAQIVP